MGYRLSFYVKMSVLLTGASWRADQVVSNHDTLTPQDVGLWDPFQMAFNSMAVINGGDPNYLLLGCPRKLVKG